MKSSLYEKQIIFWLQMCVGSSSDRKTLFRANELMHRKRLYNLRGSEYTSTEEDNVNIIRSYKIISSFRKDYKYYAKNEPKRGG